ncbi:MAG: hypothetical protein ACPG8W_12025 [Candidatus Promineifilaceae bacterium]
MHYETKNNIGFILLVIGGFLLVTSLLLLSNTTIAIITFLLGMVICGLGGYMMTRSFSDIDQDHPDYQQYQDRFHKQDQSD